MPYLTLVEYVEYLKDINEHLISEIDFERCYQDNLFAMKEIEKLKQKNQQLTFEIELLQEKYGDSHQIGKPFQYRHLKIIAHWQVVSHLWNHILETDQKNLFYKTLDEIFSMVDFMMDRIVAILNKSE